MLRQTHVPVMGGPQCRASGAVQRLMAVLPGMDERSFLCAGGRRLSDACHVSTSSTNDTFPDNVDTIHYSVH